MFLLLFMASLRNRCGHSILPLWFLLSILFFLAYSQPSQTGCLPTPTSAHGLSANLECMSEMCCTRLAENTGRKKSPKNRHLGTIEQPCSAMSSQLRYVSTIEKKMLNSNISSICPHNMANFGPLTAASQEREVRRKGRRGTSELCTSAIFGRSSVLLYLSVFLFLFSSRTSQKCVDF